MSNKSSQFKNKNGNATQIGNYLVSFEKGRFRSVKIAAVSGNWNIRYREDNPLFTFIYDLIKTEEGRNYLHVSIAAYYMVTNGVPDSEFFEDIYNARQRSFDRINKANGIVSEEEDDKILNEEKEKYKTLNNNTNDAKN
ncbi:hypothetical protein M2451_004000 [Dysgonomonas sp. PFB1-18]|uniref:hypothetical protein n=1 Tax=unclassified Dysgonomonas TaxID=2630389 RepID=UPI0024767670|nr:MULTISPECIES: hypothetical protein [unclassified Dysgonomonas]MDH6311131.1 hypothetical protein [Dysgonomonas sp. PF1-14]MDH6341015.1 hypothetical protein [Dysgonomonas sp. PF1-16]MDH6382655.1 hypothetical protein [Dysgonomonas sp. PFB1-18]MDH6399996.1 hypothetical protein [Dysgonomonas sp. PF1-23]